MSWPFGHLQMFGYDALLIDPPWRYEMYSEDGYEKSPEAQYDTMTDEELLALPVHQLAGRNCLMMMWAVWPRLDFATQLVRAWQFKYITGGVWMKRTRTGKLRVGPGYTLRTVQEPFLLARMGDPQVRLTNVLNAQGDVENPLLPASELGGYTFRIEGLAREHSRKPPEARTFLERMTPNAFRAELFARETWAGNAVWGNEAGKFVEKAVA